MNSKFGQLVNNAINHPNMDDIRRSVVTCIELKNWMLCSIQVWMKVKMFPSHSKLDDPLWDDSELACKPSTGVCLYNPLG